MKTHERKHNTGNTDPLISILTDRDNRRPMMFGCEVGIFRGETSAKILKAFPKIFLWMCDSWSTYPESHPYYQSGDKCARYSVEEQERNQRKAIENTKFAENRRKIMVRESVEAAKNWAGPPLDFVFLDASHLLDAVRADIAAWWPKVAKGGILAGHDYGHRRYPGVEQAVLEFKKQEGIEVLVSGEVWYCWKPA